MFNICSFDRVNHFQDISIFELSKVASLPAQIDKLNVSTMAVLEKKQIVEFSAKPSKLYESVNGYKPAWLQFILDIFNGTWFKAYKLRSSLLNIVNSTKSI